MDVRRCVTIGSILPLPETTHVDLLEILYNDSEGVWCVRMRFLRENFTSFVRLIPKFQKPAFKTGISAANFFLFALCQVLDLLVPETNIYCYLHYLPSSTIYSNLLRQGFSSYLPGHMSAVRHQRFEACNACSSQWNSPLDNQPLSELFLSSSCIQWLCRRIAADDRKVLQKTPLQRKES